MREAMEEKTAEPKRKHILVVEDEAELALWYKQLLEEHGFWPRQSPQWRQRA